jgi:hypothetical protein
MTTPTLDPKSIVILQGKQFVQYGGLLDLAHKMGVQAIRTTLAQIPSEANGMTAIVTAEVTMAGGAVFTGIGDASPKSVKPMLAVHAIRFAETRAKARALRDATNVGMAAVEELDDDHGHEPADRHQRRQQAAQKPAEDPAPPRDAREVANTRLRAIAGKAGKAAGLDGDGIAAALKVLMEGRSSKDLTPDELTNLALMLEEDPGALTKAVPVAAPVDSQTDADLVVLQDGRAINRTTGEVLAAPVTEVDPVGNRDAIASANKALMAALKEAFPGAKTPEIQGHATNIGMGRFKVTGTDQITAAGRFFLAEEIKAYRFDTLKLAQLAAV